MLFLCLFHSFLFCVAIPCFPALQYLSQLISLIDNGIAWVMEVGQAKVTGSESVELDKDEAMRRHYCKLGITKYGLFIYATTSYVSCYLS